MLEPDTRELLLDLLRPPHGLTLDQAVGTTYTLDLSALLVAPLAFAMFDWAVEDNGTPDPIAMLEALRRYAGRTTVFHQAGMVALPSWQPLLVHLEQCVVPVTPPNQHAIFHPKLWLLRFADEDSGAFSYRLIVLSRNLTFDTSWDTVVVLEGEEPGVGEVGPVLGSLVTDLVGSTDRLPAARRASLQELAADVAEIRFTPPEEVDEVRLHVLGFGDDAPPFPGAADRAVVISPYLTTAGVNRGLGAAGERTLVSRPESLDELPAGALSGIEARVLADGLVDDDTARATGRVHLTDDDDHRDDRVLRGLHAKVYGYELDGTTRLYTGSANATDAAFAGNVEALIELVGSTERFGLDGLLEPGDGQASFGSMLLDHSPSDEEEDSDDGLATALDRARREIGRLRFHAAVREQGESWKMKVTTDRLPDLPPAVTDVRIWRLSLGQSHAHSLLERNDHWEAVYDRVDLRGMSSFFAIEVVARTEDAEDRVRFAINATLEGAPEHRVDDVIGHVLESSDQVLRYLLFLLADSGADAADHLAALQAGTGSGTGRALFGTAPLMETLLGALARDSAKLDHVERLIEDVHRSGRADELLPEGLEDLWAAVALAREELRR